MCALNYSINYNDKNVSTVEVSDLFPFVRVRVISAIGSFHRSVCNYYFTLHRGLQVQLRINILVLNTKCTTVLPVNLHLVQLF